MAAPVENEVHQSGTTHSGALTRLEVLAQAFWITFARRAIPRSWTSDSSIQGDVRGLQVDALRDRLNKIFGSDQPYQASAESNLEEMIAERDFDEEFAGYLLSEAMDRLGIVAKELSDLAAETAMDLALIEAKRVQIDRAQAENWALLRELTGQAQ